MERDFRFFSCLIKSNLLLSGACAIYGNGIQCGDQDVVYDNDFIKTTNKVHVIMLELNISQKERKIGEKKNSLHFFVDGKQIQHTVINIPQYVHFMVLFFFIYCARIFCCLLFFFYFSFQFGVFRQMRLEVRSFRQLEEPSIDARLVCGARVAVRWSGQTHVEQTHVEIKKW
jgi:hypothetical protein